MRRLRRRLGQLGGLICLLAGLPLSLLAAPEPPVEPVRVLLVHSWEQTEDWPQAVNRGVRKVFAGSSRPIELYIENGDILRFAQREHAALAEFIAQKYARQPPDFILAVEDQGAEFVLKYRDQLFPDTPFIFVTLLERSDEQLAALGNVYQVLDQVDFQGNMDLLAEWLPRVKTLAFVSDALTPQGQQKMADVIVRARQRFPDVRDLSRADIEAAEVQLAALPPDSAVLTFGWMRDRQGRLLPPQEMIQRLSAAAGKVPVIGMFDLMLDYGAVGGKMVSGEGRGAALAGVVLQLLDQPAGRVARRHVVQQARVFSYPQLQRLGLEDLPLPAGSLLLQRPLSFYESNPLIFAAVLLCIGLLLVLSLFLVVLLRQRQQASRLLRQDEVRYRLLFEDNPSPMLVYDLQGLEVLAINQAFERDYGYASAELCGQPVTEIVVPEQREALLAGIRQVETEGLGLIKRRWISLTKQGERREVQLSGQTLEFGQRPARVVQISDISQRLAVEAALRISEQRLNQIIEASPLPTFAVDAEQRIIHWNFALELLTRVPAQSMVGKQHNLPALIGYKGRLLADAIINGRSQEALQWTDLNVHPAEFFNEGLESDSYRPEVGRWFHSIAVPLRGEDGRLQGAIQTFIDMTELRSAEAALQRLNSELEQRVVERSQALSRANEELQLAMQQLVQSEKLAALGGLVAGVAHELNTPIGNAMTVVTTLAQHLQGFRETCVGGALRRSQVSAFLHTCTDACLMLQRNTQRAAELVASFKQLAVDQTSVRRRQFRLEAAIGETLHTLTPLYRSQPVELVTYVPADIELDSYPGPLEQVIINLVENAVTHGRGDHPRLRISISAERLELPAGPGVLIQVRDDGVGMPAEVAAEVFTPFFTTRAGRGGSGLGLYVVANLVGGVLGGQIELQTAPGLGSCFSLRLPLCAPEGLADFG